MRIYIPASVSFLSATRIEPGIAYAVTEKILALGQSYEYGELECEELASDYAAMASVSFPQNQQLGRRLVLAAEVPSDSVSNQDLHDFGYVEFSEPVKWRQVYSILLDDEGVADLVGLAAQGDEAAWDDLSQRSLAWFDISERLDLAASLRS